MKWIRFTVENAVKSKSRTDSVQTETVLVRSRPWTLRSFRIAVPGTRLCGQVLQEFDDAPSYAGILDRQVSPRQGQAAPVLEKLPQIVGRSLGSGRRSAVEVWSAVEQILGRNVQDLADLEQTPGADPVRALLVFLHLLKSQTEGGRQPLLAHFEHQAPAADASADMVIDKTGGFGIAGHSDPYHSPIVVVLHIKCDWKVEGRLSSSESQVRQFVFDCVERLRDLATVEDISVELRRAGAALGFENFCISGLPSPGEQLDPYVLLSGWPAEWLDRYARGGYVHVDPVITRVRQTTMPFRWSEATVKSDDAAAKRVLTEATDFGLVDGLAVPIYTTHGFQAIVTFGARHMVPSRDERAGLHLIAIYAHGQARNLLSRSGKTVPVSSPPLSQREMDCLRWAASGKSAWDIAGILSLSQRTVEEYLANAAVKLGTVNRVQSVAEAIRRKIIS